MKQTMPDLFKVDYTTFNVKALVATILTSIPLGLTLILAAFIIGAAGREENYFVMSVLTVLFLIYAGKGIYSTTETLQKIGWFNGWLSVPHVVIFVLVVMLSISSVWFGWSGFCKLAKSCSVAYFL